MRTVDHIPVANVRPFMVADIHWVLFFASILAPAVAWVITRVLWVGLAIPFLLYLSYRATEKDMFKIEVFSTNRARMASVRSRENWEGAKTYEPR